MTTEIPAHVAHRIAEKITEDTGYVIDVQAIDEYILGVLLGNASVYHQANIIYSLPYRARSIISKEAREYGLLND